MGGAKLESRKKELVLRGELLRYDLRLRLLTVREGLIIGEAGVGLLRGLLDYYMQKRRQRSP